MKISLNWLKQFTDIDISIDELVTKIGAQLGAVEEVVDLGKKYQGIVIAKVVSCEKHPNADKLSVCLVDDGGVVEGVERNEQGLVQVVCGAPNVREGLTVAWLPPGSTVPNTVDKDPFVLGSRELRGVVSNGMLASASELAIGDDHSGIVELEIEAAPGSDFAETYQLNDYVIDIENKMFTHRPDCFGILGVAREVSGIQQKSFTSPEWYREALGRIKPGHTKLDLRVDNKLTELVPRFMAVAMADVTVRPSPLLMQTYLNRVGLRPINNVVDITNYIMYLTGQPTHAYDADKLKRYGELSLETRMSRKGDKIKLLNDKEVELQDESTILITSNDVPVGIAGVMGGADTEVDETTTSIVLECANFDMYAIRKASMRHGLFTDAVTRFNKGQSRLQNERVFAETVAMVEGLTGAHVASQAFDANEGLVDLATVRVSADFINSRLGLSLSVEEMAMLLRNVEFHVHQGADELIVTPPFWRTDIEIREDIVEEVGRLYGFDHLPQALPTRSLTPAKQDEALNTKQSIRNTLSRAGANEVLSYSFVHGNLLAKAGQNSDLAFKLSNALSPDLQCYRLSLTPSLLDKVHANIKAGYSEFALFEMGKVHSKSEIDEHGLPVEFGRLGFVIAADQKSSPAHKRGAAYYTAKAYLETLHDPAQLRYVPFPEDTITGHELFAQLQAPYDPSRSAVVYSGHRLLGVIGEFTGAVRTVFKLPGHTAGFELYLSSFIGGMGTSDKYQPVSRFPKVEQDISLRVPTDLMFGAVQSSLEEAIKGLQPAHSLSQLHPVDIYHKKSEDKKHFTFRFSLASYDRTLQSEEVNSLLDQAARSLKGSLGVERI